MLIVFGGLPGSGKTTIARALASDLRAAYLRIDTIEAAIAASGTPPEAGYHAAQALAEENLGIGTTVVVDAVNALDIIRARWREIASAARVRLIEIEIVCSDAVAHRDRLTGRDVAGMAYDPWSRAHVIDTAGETAARSIARARALVDGVA
jgi:predicted kinase